MPQITLVRHGQANSAARDEESYDKLSPLGHQQAAWLGAHFDASGERFSRVYCGTLKRHIETAAGIGHHACIQDERLNEIAYFGMAQLLETHHGIPIPNDRENFVQHLPLLFTYWRDGKIPDAPETFAYFETRVNEVMHEIAAGEGPALVVTSGGLIGMAVRVTMGLDIPSMSLACLAIQNTSVHRWLPIGDRLALIQFNALPHLDTIDRRHAQTHL